MADQSISVQGPVKVMSDSVHRVAFDLAEKVNHSASRETTRDRAYWLTLYSQCLAVVNGGDVSKILAGS